MKYFFEKHKGSVRNVFLAIFLKTLMIPTGKYLALKNTIYTNVNIFLQICDH